MLTRCNKQQLPLLLLLLQLQLSVLQRTYSFGWSYFLAWYNVNEKVKLVVFTDSRCYIIPLQTYSHRQSHITRDVTELANIRIRRMQISCAKSVGCGCRVVAQSKLLATVGFVATVIQVIQLSYLKLNSCKQTSSERLE